MTTLAAFLMRFAALVTVFLVAGRVFAVEIPLNERRSDSEFISADTRAMQNDDAAIPACCRSPMARRCGTRRPVRRINPAPIATAMPRRDERRRRALSGCHSGTKPSVDLEQRIQYEPRRRPEGGGAAVREQGAPCAHRLYRAAIARYADRGQGGCAVEEIHRRRSAPSSSAARASSKLSCAQCHDDNWGKSCRQSGAEAQPTAIRSIAWNGRSRLAAARLRSCMSAMRAEPYDFGAPALVDLEFS